MCREIFAAQLIMSHRLRRFRLKSIALLAGYNNHPKLCMCEHVAPT
jgi:hypothetical protein